MKVAIISYSESRNPGAQLQSYALQTTIRDRYPFVDKCVHIQHRTFDTKIIPPSKGAKGLLKKAFFLGTYIPTPVSKLSKSKSAYKQKESKVNTFFEDIWFVSKAAKNNSCQIVMPRTKRDC